MYDRMDASFSFNKFPKCDIRRGFQYPLTEEIVLFPQVDFKAFKWGCLSTCGKSIIPFVLGKVPFPLEATPAFVTFVGRCVQSFFLKKKKYNRMRITKRKFKIFYRKKSSLITVKNVQWCAIAMQRLLYKHYINGIALSQDFMPYSPQWKCHNFNIFHSFEHN